jgi:hypothetical protein
MVFTCCSARPAIERHSPLMKKCLQSIAMMLFLLTGLAGVYLLFFRA